MPKLAAPLTDIQTRTAKLKPTKCCAQHFVGFNAIYDSGSVVEAACWAHARRKFYDLYAARPSPLITEALRPICELYAIEESIRGMSPDVRLAEWGRCVPTSACLYRRDTRAQGIELADGVRAGARGLGALDQEVFVEKAVMVRMRVEMMRGQHYRDDRHASVQLYAHQSVDDRAGHEIVAIDAAVDDQAGRDHGGVLAAPGQQSGVQRDFKHAGDLEDIDVVRGMVQAPDLGQEADECLADDVGVPGSLDESDPAAWRRDAVGVLRHGVSPIKVLKGFSAAR